MTFDTDDYAQWLDNPVTQAVFQALTKQAEDAKAEWLKASWETGNVDPQLLADLRARAETASDICELTYEELEAALGYGDEDQAG